MSCQEVRTFAFTCDRCEVVEVVHLSRDSMTSRLTRPRGWEGRVSDTGYDIDLCIDCVYHYGKEYDR